MSKALQRLSKYVHRTPVFRSSTVDEIVGRKVYFKAENLQKTGSFKFRGALNALFEADPEQLSNGVVTHSSGNHGACPTFAKLCKLLLLLLFLWDCIVVKVFALLLFLLPGQGLAAAAQLLNVPCTVVVPHTCPATKVAALQESYGATVLFCEPTQQSRNSTVADVAEETGAVVIPPYNHVDVIAGQGTLAEEFLQQVSAEDGADGGLDAIIVPTSGGGMLAGIAGVAGKAGVKTFAVEPKGKVRGGLDVNTAPVRSISSLCTSCPDVGGSNVFQQTNHPPGSC
mgnify:FL=1